MEQTELKDAYNFFEYVKKLFEDGQEKFSEDIKIGLFSVDAGDDVREQYDLMLDYFQEKGMEINDIELDDYER